MINKNDMRKAAHDLNLKGAVVERYKLYYNDSYLGYFVSYDNYSIKIDDNSDLSSVEPDKDRLISHCLNYPYKPITFNTFVKGNNAADSRIIIKNYNNSSGANLVNCTPYMEYIESKKDIKKIRYDAEDGKNCNLFSFDVNFNTVPILKNGVYESTHYSYKAVISIPEADLFSGVYIYIIQCKDLSLPIIIVSKNMMELEDVKNAAFVGNIKSDMYNSYFHPYEKRIETYYDKVAYGEPYNGCLDLEFEENIEDDCYTTNDGIKAIKKNGITEVYLDDFKVGDYVGTDVNYIDNISFVEYMKDIDIFSPHYKISNACSIEDLLNKYPQIKGATYYLPSFNESERLSIEQIDPNDLEDTEYSEVYRINTVFEDSGDDLRCVISVKDNIFQVYTCIAGEKDMYYLYNGKNVLDIGIIEDKDNNTYTYTRTNNRFINYSKDGVLLSFRPNYRIVLDHSDTIIDTNLPLCDKFTRYNMFGVPVEF